MLFRSDIGHVGFAVEPEEYDGVPRFSHYWLDVAPKNRHPDREGVAAFLIYGRYMGGLTQMPAKISPAVDVILRRMSSPVPASFAPVEYYPQGLPIGRRKLCLSWSEVKNPYVASAEDASAVYLHIERSDKRSGSLREINGLRVASNAWMHTETNTATIEAIAPYLAAAVLYAEDLDADEIEIWGDYDLESPQWSALVQLLAVARLGISCRS